MTTAQRLKGHNFERQVAADLRRVFPDAARNLSEPRDGHTGVDLVNTGAFAVQCKRYRNYAPIAAIEEINGPGVPLLVTKADGKPAMAVLPFDALLQLLDDIGLAYTTGREG